MPYPMFESWLGNQVWAVFLVTFRTLLEFLRCLKLKWKGAPRRGWEVAMLFNPLETHGTFKLSMLDFTPQEILTSLV